ncbi:uncharacterized protein TOT_010000048 [Theileria orientalis strain Shintoku]|uniref:C2H2-type domain-containing protein n=1 Tax=Theileria orientalis strain Shintoku TaxID=869250 RepID=J7MEI0_THEOR|nr:uncharacterized protein TOT_010000048 [Theileria orientalis strain Shintoku]PVC50308.1 hypothetical protein MACL_00002341 [Theileria orientalis]BAM38579.1 uncharacterized protein TOT_010000048 [Theileria orientalis strain Shintoku]|eukprot:XP_009688880.1 uncharacterized protein TOT_010000048 [Theileria orientalis strain Shintoku]
MAPQGSAPFSSIFYLTKRKKLSEKLFEHKTETSDPEYQYNYENVYYPAFQGEAYSNVGVHKNLIYLSQDRLKFETSDGTELDVDDGLTRGLNCLSQLSDVISLNDIDEFSRGYRHRGQPEDRITGKIDDIANIVEINGFTGTEGAEYRSLERNMELSNSYVGPLSVSEVGNLLALALKLQESEKLDLDLERRLEVSAQLWKNNRVPNTVSAFLISSLYKNRPHQCETCGLRFALADTKRRHELTHRSKPHGFWHSLEGWVHLSSKAAFGFTYTRAMVTLDTFKRLLRDIPSDQENVGWLRQMLLSSEQNMDQVNMDEDVQELPDDMDDKVVATSENLGDEMTLWSWGIGGACDHVPQDAPSAEVPSEDLDPALLFEMAKNLKLSLFTINLHKPVLGSFGDMARSFCVICRDAIRCEFDVRFGKFVYVDASSFQLDFKLLSRLFPAPVPLSYLISTHGLEALSATALLKKVSPIRLVAADLRSKMALAINDWGFKHVHEMLDIDSAVPKMDGVRYLDRLFSGWRNPFKLSGAGARGLLFAHSSCLRLLLNSHLRLAKLKAASDESEVLCRLLGELALA